MFKNAKQKLIADTTVWWEKLGGVGSSCCQTLYNAWAITFLSRFFVFSAVNILKLHCRFEKRFLYEIIKWWCSTDEKQQASGRFYWDEGEDIVTSFEQHSYFHWIANFSVIATHAIVKIVCVRGSVSLFFKIYVPNIVCQDS